MANITKRTIQTERLTLRPYERSDRGRLAELLTDSEISETFMIPDYRTYEEYLGLADKLIEFSRPEDSDHLEYGIYLGDTLIGFVNDCGIEDTEIEIGYIMDPAYKNHGYTTEAVRAVINELWEMGFRRITAGYFEGNEASRRVMEKCGMKRSGEEETDEYRGKTLRCFICEILRNEGHEKS